MPLILPRSSAFKRAERLPDDLDVQEQSASLMIQLLGRYEEATPIIDRAQRLLSDHPELISEHLRGSWTLSVGVWERWLDDDVEGALSEASRVRKLLQADRKKGFELSRDATFLGYQYLALGKVGAAKEMALEFGARSIRFLPVLAFIARDPDPLVEMRADRVFETMVSLDLGSTQPVQAGANVPKNSGSGERELLLGKIAFEEGRFEEASSLLQKGLESLDPSLMSYVVYRFLGSLFLADALEASGDLKKAANVLEQLSTYRKRTYPENGVFWMVAQIRLARLYRSLGRIDEARKVENHVRHLLKFADPDLPETLRLDK